MEDFNIKVQNFRFNVMQLNRNYSILTPLTLLYLQHKGYLQLVKSKSKGIIDSSESGFFIANRDLTNLERESNMESLKATHEELIDYNNGILVYAIIAVIPETEPLYTTITQAISYIKEAIDRVKEVVYRKQFAELVQSYELRDLFDFYDYLCKNTFEEEDIKEFSNTLFDIFLDNNVYSSCYGGLNKKEHNEITKLMLYILGAKNGCMIHPYAGPANIVSYINDCTYYSAGYSDEHMDYALAYDIYAKIHGIRANFSTMEIPYELADFTANYVFHDNISTDALWMWNTIFHTVANDARGVFLISTSTLSRIRQYFNEEQLTHIASYKLSHIIFIKSDLAIVVIKENKKNNSYITIVDETDSPQISSERMLNDIRHSKRCYKLNIEEFNKENFKLDINNIIGNINREKIIKEKEAIQLKDILSSNIIHRLWGSPSYDYYIASVHVQDYSKFLPYYTIEYGNLVDITESEAKQYKYVRLLIELKNRKLYQPKILAYDSLDGLKISGNIKMFTVNENIVDIKYLVKEMTEEYFINQIFPTQADLTNINNINIKDCYIKIPHNGTRTPLERQKILLNAKKMEFIDKLLRSYDYDVEKIVSGKKAGWLKNGSTLLEGRYNIVKRLGNGGFGKTYKATRKNEDGSNTIVAIKEFFDQNLQKRERGTNNVLCLSKDIKDITVVRNKFFTEAEKIKNFADCENIIKVYDVFDENNTSYYSMEYIEGKNLHDYIKKHGVLKEKEAIKIIKGVANALKRMHSDRMLHMDIKPKNIMIGKDRRVVLIDFGGAHKYNISSQDNSTFARIGSPGFTPPELASSVSFSPTYDIYSLGATLYYILTGITHEDVSEGSRQLNSENIGIMQYPPLGINISEETKKCMEKSLAYLSKERQQSIDEFLAMLPCE